MIKLRTTKFYYSGNASKTMHNLASKLQQNWIFLFYFTPCVCASARGPAQSSIIFPLSGPKYILTGGCLTWPEIWAGSWCTPLGLAHMRCWLWVHVRQNSQNCIHGKTVHKNPRKKLGYKIEHAMHILYKTQNYLAMLKSNLFVENHLTSYQLKNLG